jgi:cytochrome c oxidase subunit 3/cytochrome o ubiquinol oxidase subunit 3
VSHAAAHAVEHPPTSTGLDTRKLAIWTFIGSECLFFASLISTYLVYKGKSLVGPLPHQESQCMLHGKLQQCEAIFEIPLVTFGTAVLLFSSFFVVMALNGAQTGRRRRLVGWLSATVAGGLFFVGMQVYEFTHFVHKGLGYTTNLFGSTFYTLTGFHGTHVTVGVIWLGTLLVLAVRGKLPPEKALNLELAALYWHFVDVVWIVIFPTVYLMR